MLKFKNEIKYILKERKERKLKRKRKIQEGIMKNRKRKNEKNQWKVK